MTVQTENVFIQLESLKVPLIDRMCLMQLVEESFDEEVELLFSTRKTDVYELQKTQYQKWFIQDGELLQFSNIDTTRAFMAYDRNSSNILGTHELKYYVP